MAEQTTAQETPSADPAIAQAEVLYPNKEAEATKTAEAPVVETKPVEEKKSEEKPTEGEAKPVEYKLTLPEGSPLDAKAIEALTAFAKEKGLSVEQAQLTLERESGAVTAFAQAQQQQFETTKLEWYEAAKSDKEIGGDNFAQSAENAKRIVNKYGSAAFKQELDRTGLGNHPELLRVFARIGKEMQSDSFVKPGAMASSPKSAESVFYPNLK